MVITCLLDDCWGLFKDVNINVFIVGAIVSGVEACGPFPLGAPWAKGCVAKVVWLRVFEEAYEDVLERTCFFEYPVS